MRADLPAARVRAGQAQGEPGVHESAFGPARPQGRHRLEPPRRGEIEKQSLYDVTRAGAIEAIFRYPTPPPGRFFPWLGETIAYRTLDHLRDEFTQNQTRCPNAEEAAALQAALAGFEQADPPSMRDRAGMREWRSRIHMRDVFEVVEKYYDERAVADVCRAAVGRLAPGQRQVIEGYYFQKTAVPVLAARRAVSESTIYNTKNQAEARLHADDVFFSALYHLGVVRDRARAIALRARYPDDGRRIVVIDPAA
ncbi:MAG: hypothetical protein ACRDPC_05805 [Solirubrobacteraceae bacterium]